MQNDIHRGILMKKINHGMMNYVSVVKIKMCHDFEQNTEFIMGTKYIMDTNDFILF